jgi:hypothetical protein
MVTAVVLGDYGFQLPKSDSLIETAARGPAVFERLTEREGLGEAIASAMPTAKAVRAMRNVFDRKTR